MRLILIASPASSVKPKILASLNHTNIGHIYGLKEAEGQKALELELVEGPALADRIAKAPRGTSWEH